MKPMKRWLLGMGWAIVVLGGIGLLVPHIVRARFTGSQEIAFQVRVLNSVTSQVIAGAEVTRQLDPEFSKVEGVTDADGFCTWTNICAAGGVFGGRASFTIGGSMMIVRAPGYVLWEKSLRDMYGARIEYDRTPPRLKYEVRLIEQRPAGNAP